MLPAGLSVLSGFVVRELERACRKGRDLLARRGGDKFLVLFPEAAPETIEARLAVVGERLRGLSRSGEVFFSMSLSYGIVDGAAAKDAEALACLADVKMYAQKSGRRR